MERSDIERPIRSRGHDPRTSTSILKGHPPYLRHFVYFVADKTLKPSALQPRANMVFHFASNFFFPLFFPFPRRLPFIPNESVELEFYSKGLLPSYGGKVEG